MQGIRPIVEMEEKDFTAAAGDTVTFAAEISDPDGDNCTAEWTIDPTGGVYHSDDMAIYEWKADTAEASFTIPADAASGDCFTLNLRARDDADAMMTRYAEVRIVVE